EAIDLVNLYAPEHLSLMVADAPKYLGRIRNAGGIFLGENSPEALGDYVAGPSHVLPTGGTARFASPLGVDDFLKRTILVALNDDALRRLGPPTITLARAEGLSAHARAVELRLRK
ncbi:MAG: histidinol dehydrogenase, partial [Dehalococcoidia bacterium]